MDRFGCSLQEKKMGMTKEEVFVVVKEDMHEVGLLVGAIEDEMFVRSVWRIC